MVRTNPIPEGLRGRPFSEQAEALPAREALRAVLSEAPGFRDETPDPVTFATGLLPLANAIFRGDMPLEVNQFSQGEQMECVGQAVHQLVRENYLQRTVFQDFGQTLLEVTKAVESRAAAMKMELSICDEERAPDPVVGQFRVNDKGLNAPVTVAMLDARDATNKRSFETMLSDNNVTLTASITEIVKQQMTEALAAARERPPQAAAPAPAQPAAALTLAGAGGAQPPQQGRQPGAGALALAAAPGPPPPALVLATGPPPQHPPPQERPEGGAPLSAEAPAFIPVFPARSASGGPGAGSGPSVTSAASTAGSRSAGVARVGAGKGSVCGYQR